MILIVFVILAVFSVSLGFVENINNRNAPADGQAVNSDSDAASQVAAEESSAPPVPADAVTAATPNGGVPGPGGSTDTVTGATSDASSGSYSPAPDATTGATPASSPTPAPDTTTGPTPAPSPTPAPDTTTGPTPAPSPTPAPEPDTNTGPTPPAPAPTEPTQPEEKEDEREGDSTVTIGWLHAESAIGSLTAAAALPVALLRTRFNPVTMALYRIMYEIQLRGGEKLSRR